MVTILLATFNGERYLAQQLESILEQDEQNITIEICDDGSVDGTVEIIKKFQELYPEKVKWMEKEKPSKSAKENFFYMLSKAKDSDLPYVMLADQDDLWLPNKVSTMFGRMKKMEERYGSEMPIFVMPTWHLRMKISILHIRIWLSLWGNCHIKRVFAIDWLKTQ